MSKPLSLHHKGTDIAEEIGDPRQRVLDAMETCIVALVRSLQRQRANLRTIESIERLIQMETGSTDKAESVSASLDKPGGKCRQVY